MPDSLFRGRLVRLTAPRPEDTETMARWSENSTYSRLVDTDYARPRPAKAFAEKEDETPPADALEFRIRTIAEDRLVGFVALHHIEWSNGSGEISIGIGEPADWDKGYGSEAMRLTLNYAFNELNLHRVGLDVLDYNARALHVYEKLGFVHEGAKRQFGRRDGRRYDLVLMGMLRDEWKG